jgi:hypothetical protein
MSAGSLALDLLIGPLPGGGPPPAPTLEAWARARGLRHEAEGLLAPLTPRLRRALGAGAHTAAQAPAGDGWLATSGPQRPRSRPERRTTDLCRGLLPGDLDGVLAHHTHLVHDPGGEGPDWVAHTATVVVAAPPGAGRAVGVADAGRRHPVRAGLVVGRERPSGDPRGSVVPQPCSRFEAHGVAWSLRPAEPEATREALAEAGAALAAAGHAEVEIEFGAVCVWVQGAVTEPARLDALCRAAAAVAGALRDAAEREPALRAAASAGRREDTERLRWLDAGVATVAWPDPPADIPEAVAAYAAVASGPARRTSRRVVFWLLVATLSGIAAALWALAEAGYAYGGVVTTVFGSWLALKVIRAFVGAGRDIGRAETDARAVPWGVEAFLRGYAGSRGLTAEDPDALRRRLDAPIRGRAVLAAHGPVAPGADGHVAFWREPVPGAPDRHWAMAIVAAPANVPPAPAGMRVDVRAGLLIVREEVEEAGRSAEALDRVAAAAGALA